MSATDDSLKPLLEVLARRVRERMASRSLRLPPAPEVALTLAGALQTGEMSAGQLARLVARDPALSARMLQAANAVAFRGAGRPVDRLDAAIARLGLTVTRTIALCAALGQRFRCRSAALDQLMRGVWQHSLETAVTGASLARHVAGLDPQRLTTAAMLHQIGVLPLVDELSQPEWPSPTAEQAAALIFPLQAEVGAWVLARWNLPDWLCQMPLALEQGHATGHDAALAEVLLIARASALAADDPRHVRLAALAAAARARLGWSEAIASPGAGDPALREALGLPPALSEAA